MHVEVAVGSFMERWKPLPHLHVGVKEGFQEEGGVELNE